MALPPGWAPYAVVEDAAGTLWATVLDPPGIARVTPAGGSADEIRHEVLPAGAGRPMLLAIAADGALWCTRADDRLSRRDASGTHAVIDLRPGTAPYGIAAAADGGIWFTAPGRNRIGHRTPIGEVVEIDLPVAAAQPAMITVDAGGTAWAALNGVGALAAVDDGGVRIITLPAGRVPASPVGVAASAAGVWYADIAGGCVGRVEPSGVVRQHHFADAGCRPHAVAADSDGGCWVTLWASGQLARVTADGAVTLHDLPGREPHGLWVADSVVWVAMESGSLVAVAKSEVG
ncbi:hydrolase [Micromonospora rifamycinica]|uniref:Vgb family protein n=1 Tax=Micromonospora rifamycinica TaxID=291594 RepID=UPI0034120B33